MRPKAQFMTIHSSRGSTACWKPSSQPRPACLKKSRSISSTSPRKSSFKSKRTPAWSGSGTTPMRKRPCANNSFTPSTTVTSFRTKNKRLRDLLRCPHIFTPRATIIVFRQQRGPGLGWAAVGPFAGSGPAALREFHRVLASGGLVAVATLSARQPLLQAPAANRWKPQHNPSQAEMRALFEKRRVRRQRPAPCPATGVDSDRVRPDNRRHQELTQRMFHLRGFGLL